MVKGSKQIRGKAKKGIIGKNFQDKILFLYVPKI